MAMKILLKISPPLNRAVEECESEGEREINETMSPLHTCEWHRLQLIKVLSETSTRVKNVKKTMNGMNLIKFLYASSALLVSDNKWLWLDCKSRDRSFFVSRRCRVKFVFLRWWYNTATTTMRAMSWMINVQKKLNQTLIFSVNFKIPFFTPLKGVEWNFSQRKTRCWASHTHHKSEFNSTVESVDVED